MAKKRVCRGVVQDIELDQDVIDQVLEHRVYHVAQSSSSSTVVMMEIMKKEISEQVSKAIAEARSQPQPQPQLIQNFNTYVLPPNVNWDTAGAEPGDLHGPPPNVEA
jgi:hypothetical protein